MLSPNLNRDSKIPLYEQLYTYIKHHIQKGNLKQGEKLPSKRNLSNHLDISINTVSRSYEDLLAEGYIYSLERKGFFISNIKNLATLDIKESVNIERQEKKKAYKYDFKINKTDYHSFPKYSWKKIINQILSGSSYSFMESLNPQGNINLRKSIANYLLRSRDVKTNYENIIISSSTNYILQTLLYILPKNSIFAVENPGYKALSRQLELNDIKYLPIGLDRFGLNYNELRSSPSNVALITPSHQFPTGVIMPVNRRLEILSWANKKEDNYIIEDDYDSEFKYYGSPIPALKSLDSGDKVIYIGNFSKSISPSIRISYMVLPNRLLKNYLAIRDLMTCPVPSLTQITMSEFIDQGYFERHLNRMRKTYDDKRKILIKTFGHMKDIRLIDSMAGLHLILEIRREVNERNLIRSILSQDIYLETIKKFYDSTRPYKGNTRLILGYGKLPKKDLLEGSKTLLQIFMDLGLN